MRKQAVADKIKSQTNSLVPSPINKVKINNQVKDELFLTMIDDKVAQLLTYTPSSSSCTTCRTTPRQMNDLTKVTAKPENENSFQYGLSTSHDWIHCMKMTLHTIFISIYQADLYALGQACK